MRDLPETEERIKQLINAARAYEEFFDIHTLPNNIDPVGTVYSMVAPYNLNPESMRNLVETARRVKKASIIVNQLKRIFHFNGEGELKDKENFYKKFYGSEVPENIKFEPLKFAIISYINPEYFLPFSDKDKPNNPVLGLNSHYTNIDEILDNNYHEIKDINREPKYEHVDLLLLNINHEEILKNFNYEERPDNFLILEQPIPLNPNKKDINYNLETIKNHEYKHFIDSLIISNYSVANEISAELFEGRLEKSTILNDINTMKSNYEFNEDTDSDFSKLDRRMDLQTRLDAKIKLVNEFPLDVAKSIHDKNISARTLSYIVSLTPLENLASTFCLVDEYLTKNPVNDSQQNF